MKRLRIEEEIVPPMPYESDGSIECDVEGCKRPATYIATYRDRRLGFFCGTHAEED